MYDFHKDKDVYFQIQYKNSGKSIVPFVENIVYLGPSTHVLEIGSAEGGNLKPFAEKGCICTGIELSPSRTELAKKYLVKEIEEGKVTFINEDIYQLDPQTLSNKGFDLIFLKDVLEHIPDQDKLMEKLKDLLKPDGKIYLGFPSWYMAFGGHQQMCRSKILSRLPYFHIMPMAAYKKILKWFNKDEKQNEMLIEVKETGISVNRFEKILKKEKFNILKRQFYFVPPIYTYKFNLKTRELPGPLSSIPFLREPFITSAYYLIEMA